MSRSCAAALAMPEYKVKVERALVIKVEAFDWNCPQHITQRFTLAEIEPAVSSLRAKIAELKRSWLRRRLSGCGLVGCVERILRDDRFAIPQDEAGGCCAVSRPTNLILRDRRGAAIVSKDVSQLTT